MVLDVGPGHQALGIVRGEAHEAESSRAWMTPQSFASRSLRSAALSSWPSSRMATRSCAACQMMMATSRAVPSSRGLGTSHFIRCRVLGCRSSRLTASRLMVTAQDVTDLLGGSPAGPLRQDRRLAGRQLAQLAADLAERPGQARAAVLGPGPGLQLPTHGQ